MGSVSGLAPRRTLSTCLTCAWRKLANGLRDFAQSQRGEGRWLLETAALHYERLALGGWTQFRPGPWIQNDTWFLVFDRGAWQTEAGDILEGVTHWQYLPVPPFGAEEP